MFKPGAKNLTPVMRQYREAKEAYPDAILFFRLGDFYEMFNDDAVVAARELQLTLTSRNKGKPDAVPMAGVPVHSAHNYLSRLIARGHKVAICEQMGDPTKIKGIVPRKVVRVLTPGLLTAEDQLEARRNNYLCAVDAHLGGYGLAQLDLSTGELGACAVASDALLLCELARAEPREALLGSGLNGIREALAAAVPHTALRDDGALADDEVPHHLDHAVAAPLYADAARQHPPAALRAVARVLRFATRYLPDAVLPVVRVGHHDPDAFMRVDETAQAHLELVRGADGHKEGSLLAAIDATVTAQGGRLLRRQLLSPLMDVAAIRRRHDAVALFVSNPRARQELRQALAGVGDLERLTVRVSLEEASPRDLAALRQSLDALPAARAAIASIAGVVSAETLALDVDLLEDVAARLREALADDPPLRLSDGGVFREGFDAELDELAALRKRGKSILDEMADKLRSELSIPSLKIRYTRAFGWYIEVTKAHVDKVPSSWRRRQTLTNAERYLDDALEELADKLDHAEERVSEREGELFRALVAETAAHAERLRRLAAAVAQWDVSSALAETAHQHDYCRPEVDDGDAIDICDGRHPVVERHVPSGQFVPNDTTLDLGGERLWLITGPNMAGKSTLMRQVALITILAQAGSFVPATRARIGVVDRVLSRVGASDNLARGESTFMVEMRETAAILRHASRRSLVILDEIGRGTSTYDGLAIAWAVAEHLHDRVSCRALFATHYHQLTELADELPHAANYSVSAREHQGDIVFLHRLTAGAVSKSYGVAVARLANLPESVLGRASAILAALESDTPIAGGPGASQRDDAQLDLFAQPKAPTCSEAEKAALLQLAAVDVDRMTPLEALQLLGALQRAIQTDTGPPK